MDALRWVLLIIGIVVFILVFLVSKKKSIVPGVQVDGLDDDDLIDAGFGKIQPELNESLSLNELARDMRLDDEINEVNILTEEKKKNTVKSDPASEEKEMLIIFYLLASNSGILKGSQIIDALTSVGMHYGDMKVFHYYDDDLKNQKKTVFSVANIEEPGWFDLVTINQVSTPGITIFMNLPVSMGSVKAFDAMLGVIDQLLKILPVTLKDKKHDKISRQTLAHLREEVVEFERRRSIVHSD